MIEVVKEVSIERVESRPLSLNHKSGNDFVYREKIMIRANWAGVQNHCRGLYQTTREREDVKK